MMTRCCQAHILTHCTMWRSKRNSQAWQISGISLRGLAKVPFAATASKCSLPIVTQYTYQMSHIIIRTVHNTDPVAWAKMYSSKHDRMFKYSQNAGTSALFGHVDHCHLLEHITLAAENGWTIWIDSVKNAMAHGYTLNEIQGALTNGASLDSLPPRQLATLEAATSVHSGHGLVPPFLTKELHKHIVAFIVVDDQVFVLILDLMVIPNI